jgi:hypothetical protein
VIIRTDVATTAITYHEILSGIKHRKAKREGEFFRRFFSRIRILDFDLNAAENEKNVKRSKRKNGAYIEDTGRCYRGTPITS